MSDREMPEVPWANGPDEAPEEPRCFACDDSRANERCASCTAEAEKAHAQLEDRLVWIREAAEALLQHRFEPSALIAGAYAHGAGDSKLARALADELRGMAADLGVRL